ncbi:flagella assembly protein FlgT middle domain-containing protein [Paraferrimonas sedimenticola]|uniref:Flagellar assembly protein T middle domain-containing protein n=1 Tax=Paraferrimonas sedimenticola TaxID=375674 RepID=A0AA37RPV2_9GAMM|nr:flagella assembly protein FlgT middle domain-containing protein [Paraferrimonas sedimenticola]GLP95000.1 hypothetical protein GCM10007895_03060 [Paraferrimonas sedimenticola]
MRRFTTRCFKFGLGSLLTLSLGALAEEPNRVTVEMGAVLGAIAQPSCIASDSQYRASVLIPKVQVKHPSQLRVGQVFEIETWLAAQLARSMNQVGQQSYARTQAKALEHLAKASDDARAQRISASGDQYLLQLELVDFSTGPYKSFVGGLFESSPQRNMVLSVNLYDGTSGRAIWNKVIERQEDWDFSRDEAVSLNSRKFQRSDFGKLLSATTDWIAAEVNSVIQQRPLRAPLRQSSGNRLYVDLGAEHGLKIGDKLQLKGAANKPFEQQTATVTVVDLESRRARIVQDWSVVPLALNSGDTLELPICKQSEEPASNAD